MTQRHALRQRHDWRPLRDFIIAFLIFFGSTLAFYGGAPAPRSWGAYERLAQAYHEAPTTVRQNFGETSVVLMQDQPPAWPVFERPPTLALFLLLAAMFAAFATFNLAVVRHLRRVSASPLRRSWREG